MGLITKEVQVKIWNQNAKFFEEKGYDVPKRKSKTPNKKEYCYDVGKYITVKTEDLPDGSHIKVLISCDFCFKEYEVEYRNYKQSIDNYGTCACQKCTNNHQLQTLRSLYGNDIDNISKVPWVRDKAKQTLLEKYGVENIWEYDDLHDLQKKE